MCAWKLKIFSDQSMPSEAEHWSDQSQTIVQIDAQPCPKPISDPCLDVFALEFIPAQT